MTDKEQIIIHGVDVSGCKYLNTFSDCDGYHYYCDLSDYINNEYCEYYKDCYFKQLARKTQELEVICKAFDIEYAYNDDGKIFGRSNKLRSLEQECEELKERNALLESQMAFNLSEMEIKLGNEINRSETLLKELKRFDKIKDDFREMAEKLKTENACYRKALDEIAKESRQIVEDECTTYQATGVCYTFLDIINKAKGAEDG